MNATQLTVNVPDDQQADVAGWEDGKSYTLTVKQTDTGMFDLVSSEGADEEAAEPASKADEGMMDKGGDTAISDNPAVVILAKSKK